MLLGKQLSTIGCLHVDISYLLVINQRGSDVRGTEAQGPDSEESGHLSNEQGERKLWKN